MDRYRMTPIVAIAALLVAGACETQPDTLDDIEPADDATVIDQTATEPLAYSQWDLDQDQMLGRDEFGTWYGEQGLFDDWDVGADEGLDREEFGTGLFGAWDTDRNETLSESEWTTGAERGFANTEYGEFGDWDTSGDGMIDQTEFNTAFAGHGYYDRVDTDRDAVIDDEELADWFFDVFDSNDDTRLDTTEWESTWFQG